MLKSIKARIYSFPIRLVSIYILPAKANLSQKSLKGVAKLFVLSEKGIHSWSALKSCLLSEFRSRVSSKQIHKQLSQNPSFHSTSVIFV